MYELRLLSDDTEPSSHTVQKSEHTVRQLTLVKAPPYSADVENADVLSAYRSFA